MSLMPAPGNTIPVRRLLNENRWPLIAEKMVSKQIYYTIHILIIYSIFTYVEYNFHNLHICGVTVILCMCAGIPKFGLAIVKDGFVLDNVVAITLATRSVLCRMLTAGVAALPRSGSVESVCNTIWPEIWQEDIRLLKL